MVGERLLLIGGGELRTEETLPLDEVLVETAGGRPRALFVPTASGDDPAYIEAFERVYGLLLGCEVRVARVASDADSELDALFNWADLVYVGGGNTRKMVRLWGERGVDARLAKASSQGKVLGGISAGMICWFKNGCSDSDRFEGAPKAELTVVDGLGWVSGMACPHLVREPDRWPAFRRFLAQSDGNPWGLGIDDLCAVQVEGGRCRVLSADGTAKAYVLRKEGSGLATRSFRDVGGWWPWTSSEGPIDV